MNVLLRPAEPADAEDVAEIYLTSRKTYLPFAPLAHSDAEIREWIVNELIASGGVTVATADGAVVGMIAVCHDKSHGWIDHLYLHPSVCGRGIGSQLLEHALGKLGSPVRLYTFQANSGARRFYERHGFVPVVFSDGEKNEEKCPDILYELNTRPNPSERALGR